LRKRCDALACMNIEVSRRHGSSRFAEENESAANAFSIISCGRPNTARKTATFARIRILVTCPDIIILAMVLVTSPIIFLGFPNLNGPAQ
jgi:hypothetical protein